MSTDENSEMVQRQKRKFGKKSNYDKPDKLDHKRRVAIKKLREKVVRVDEDVDDYDL